MKVVKIEIKPIPIFLFSNDEKISGPASMAWNQFESGLLKLLPQAEENKTLTDEDIQNEIARARVQLHYIKDECFIDGKKILSDVKKLQDMVIDIEKQASVNYTSIGNELEQTKKRLFAKEKRFKEYKSTRLGRWYKRNVISTS